MDTSGSPADPRSGSAAPIDAALIDGHEFEVNVTVVGDAAAPIDAALIDGHELDRRQVVTQILRRDTIANCQPLGSVNQPRESCERVQCGRAIRTLGVPIGVLGDILKPRARLVDSGGRTHRAEGPPLWRSALRRRSRSRGWSSVNPWVEVVSWLCCRTPRSEPSSNW